MPMAKLIANLLVHLHAVILFLPKSGALYNVVHYGALPDGATDSTRPFLRAWADACSSHHPATVYVPGGKFLVGRATFSGPCNNRAMTFAIAGTVIAPQRYGGYDSSGRWITFDTVQGLTISGGTLDGRGRPLWNCKRQPHGRRCPSGASSLTISNSKDVVVDGVTSVDSELFHVVVMQCSGVTVRGVTIEAPSDSPNTDGIHIHRSSHVAVYNVNVSTGDDCVSVGPGNAHLWIEGVACGPGHGISIGSLGKQEGMAVEAVQNVTVKTTWFTGTQNGLRIKTWGTSKRGFVRGVTFVDSTMSNVDNPIIIDQQYCPNDIGCTGKSSGIKISQVKYVGIHGSSTTPVAVSFDCSRSNPCSGISMQNVKLTYQNQVAKSYCRNAQGSALGLVAPPSCL